MAGSGVRQQHIGWPLQLQDLTARLWDKICSPAKKGKLQASGQSNPNPRAGTTSTALVKPLHKQDTSMVPAALLLARTANGTANNSTRLPLFVVKGVASAALPGVQPAS
jgi:hypothetical protein